MQSKRILSFLCAVCMLFCTGCKFIKIPHPNEPLPDENSSKQESVDWNTRIENTEADLPEWDASMALVLRRNSSMKKDIRNWMAKLFVVQEYTSGEEYLELADDLLEEADELFYDKLMQLIEEVLFEYREEEEAPSLARKNVELARANYDKARWRREYLGFSRLNESLHTEESITKALNELIDAYKKVFFEEEN